MTPTPLNRRQFSIATGAALVAGFHTAQAQEERIVLGQSAAFTGPAAQLGIQGVPCFVVDRKFGVTGAQPAEQLLALLDRAAVG